MSASTAEMVVFLGPSLPAREAKAIAQCEVLGPARQGDLWRALVAYSPRIVVLIDGVFELQPSIWHREITWALDSGVTVIGGGSMGALRAAELQAEGMVGVGKIFESYASGKWVDDADVALLHAAAEDGYRPLTVPLVNVRHLAEAAIRRNLLSRSQAKSWVATAANIFYQERSWPRLFKEDVIEAAPEKRERLKRLALSGKVDLKAEDARACLREAERRRKKGRVHATPVSAPAHDSSTARRSRLYDGQTWIDGNPVSSAEVLAALRLRDDGPELIQAGMARRRAADLARGSGVRLTDAEAKNAAAAWAAEFAGRSLAQATRENALDTRELSLLWEDVGLEQKWLNEVDVVTDGPSTDEALASEARRRHLWSATARHVLQRRVRQSKAKG